MENVRFVANVGAGFNAANPSRALNLRYANRHGLITGATGSGKTVSMLRMIAEFNANAVPTFFPDVKGDVSGILMGNPQIDLRYLNPGRNLKLSLLDLGPELAARALGLTDAQQGFLERALASGEAVHTPSQAWKHIAGMKGEATRNAIKRQFIRLRPELFGRGFDVASLIDTQEPVTCLNARELVEDGNLYCVHILYMLRELMTRLPERGDAARPVLAFFIDEAHMLFKDCPPRLLAELERVVRLIRSKGVSLWFVTQSPSDIPPVILGQLANRIQHSLRASTPQDWKAVQVAVDTMPAPSDSSLKLYDLIGTMPPGQALVSLVRDDGMPSSTSWCKIIPPLWNPPRKPEAVRNVLQADSVSTDAVSHLWVETSPAAVPQVEQFKRMWPKLQRVASFIAPVVYLLGKLAFACIGLTVAVVIAITREQKRAGRSHR